MKRVEAILIARSLVVLALFPALAGCAVQEAGEPLAPGVVPRGDAPGEPDAPAWAAAADALVRPGTIIHTESRDCLSNFVFYRPDNHAVFLGTTAYCTRDVPIGAVTAIGDEGVTGFLVYNSMLAMQEAGETDPDALEYNDFALYYVDRDHNGDVSPELPVVGGPQARGDGAAPAVGDILRAFARAPELPRETDWRDSVVSGRAGDWAILTYGAMPAAPGTTGGGVIDEDGNAVGILVTLGVVPNPGAQGVARLDSVMEYARTHGKLPIELGTPQP